MSESLPNRTVAAWKLLSDNGSRCNEPLYFVTIGPRIYFSLELGLPLRESFHVSPAESIAGRKPLGIQKHFAAAAAAAAAAWRPPFFFLCLVVHVWFFFFAGTASEKHATRHWHEMARRVSRWCQCGLLEKVVVTCWRKGGNLAKKKQQKIKQQELEVRRVIKMSCHWCICATSMIFLTWRLNDWTSEMILSVAQVKGMTFCRLFWRAKSSANSQTN